MASGKWSKVAFWLSALSITVWLIYSLFTRGTDLTILDSDWLTPFFVSCAIATLASTAAIICAALAVSAREGTDAWTAAVAAAFSMIFLLGFVGWSISSVISLVP